MISVICVEWDGVTINCTALHKRPSNLQGHYILVTLPLLTSLPVSGFHSLQFLVCMYALLNTFLHVYLWVYILPYCFLMCFSSLSFPLKSYFLHKACPEALITVLSVAFDCNFSAQYFLSLSASSASCSTWRLISSIGMAVAYAFFPHNFDYVQSFRLLSHSNTVFVFLSLKDNTGVCGNF